MKRGMLLTAIVPLLLSILPALGQSWETKATVNVPFEFVVGNAVLPAGDYAIMTTMTNTGTLLIQNVASGACAFPMIRNIVLRPPGTTAPNSQLVFALEGDRHTLHQVIVWGDDHKHDLIHGKEIAELRETTH